MEKESVLCKECGAAGSKGGFHHSQVGDTLCAQCFRTYIRRRVVEERKVPCKKAVSRHTETLAEVRLQAKISTKLIANDIRKAEIARRQHNIELLQTDIEDLDKQLRVLTMTLIRSKYRLICVIPLEQVSLMMCEDCMLRVMEQSRPFAGKSVQSGNVSRLEVASCKCCCM